MFCVFHISHYLAFMRRLFVTHTLQINDAFSLWLVCPSQTTICFRFWISRLRKKKEGINQILDAKEKFQRYFRELVNNSVVKPPWQLHEDPTLPDTP